MSSSLTGRPIETADKASKVRQGMIKVRSSPPARGGVDVFRGRSGGSDGIVKNRYATDGGELTHSYSVESNNEVKMTKQEIIEMIECAGFEAVERDTVYNRVAAV